MCSSDLLPDFTQKNDKFGLGFTAEAQRAVRKEKIRKAPVFISSSRVNSIEEDVEEAEFDSWIYPTTSNGPSNWTTKDFTPINKILSDLEVRPPPYATPLGGASIISWCQPPLFRESSSWNARRRSRSESG